MKIKLSAIEESVKGKRVVLIDDSIVRGTTSGRIVRLLREAGAKEIHMRISSPPFLHPCYYGTDIDSREHLIACHHSVSETAGIIGADSLGYLPVSELDALIGREEKLENSREGLLGGCGARIREGRAVCENRGFCSACFDGDYPTEVPSDTRKNRFEQRLSERKALQLKEN